MKNQQVNCFVIFLTLLIPSSFMYVFDWPQSLSTALQNPPYSYSLNQVQLLYTIPQVVALLLCFKLGMIFDQMKLQKLLLLVPSVILLSHTIVAITFIVPFAGTYPLTIIFRGIFALVGESTFTLQAMILRKLLGENASFILGFGSIIPAVFQPLNSLFTPMVFNSSKQISAPLFTGSGVCLMVLLICIYLKFKINDQKKQQIQNQSPPPAEGNTEVQQNKNNIIDQMKLFQLPFWLVQLQILIMYILTFVFVSIAFDLIVKRFQFEYTKGGQIIMIPFLTSILFSLMWLYLIKKFPSYRRIFYIVINLLAFISHMCLYFLPNSDGGDNSFQLICIVFILIFIGISIGGLLMVIVPTLYLVSKKQQTGAAFSFSTISVSFDYVVIPLIIGYISSSFGDLKIGYRYTSFVFIGFSILGLIISCYIKLNDNKFAIYDKKIEDQKKVQEGLGSKQELVKVTSSTIIEDKSAIPQPVTN